MADDVLETLELSRSDITDPGASIDRLQAAQFAQEAARALGDPAFGVRAGLMIENAVGLAGYMTRYSDTLRSAFECATKYQSLTDPVFFLGVEETAATVSIYADGIDPSFAPYSRNREFLAFGILGWLRKITNTDLTPIRITFSHAAGSSMQAIADCSPCPVSFGAEKNELILPISCIDLPIQSHDPILIEHLRCYAERLLKDQPNEPATLRGQIDRILFNALPKGLPGVDEVASEMGMTKRTLSRRLSDDGLSFREILDDFRCAAAKTFLSEGFTISRVAYDLDYADQASFSTAFKRWTGQSPSEYRNRN